MEEEREKGRRVWVSRHLLGSWPTVSDQARETAISHRGNSIGFAKIAAHVSTCADKNQGCVLSATDRLMVGLVGVHLRALALSFVVSLVCLGACVLNCGSRCGSFMALLWIAERVADSYFCLYFLVLYFFCVGRQS